MKTKGKKSKSTAQTPTAQPLRAARGSADGVRVGQGQMYIALWSISKVAGDLVAMGTLLQKSAATLSAATAQLSPPNAELSESARGKQKP